MVFVLLTQAAGTREQPPQHPATFPVALKPALTSNASPEVPKIFAMPVMAAIHQAPFAVVMATPVAADSEVWYAPAFLGNMQTVYVPGILGYSGAYVPTPTVPLYTMQYECLCQPTFPLPTPLVAFRPMEEGSLLLANDAPPSMLAGRHIRRRRRTRFLLQRPPRFQQQPSSIIQNSGRRHNRKRRRRRRRGNASHRGCATTVDGEAGTTPELVCNSPVANLDFTSTSEFPSLPVRDLPQRQSPSDVSYSTALQKVPSPQQPLMSSVGGGKDREAGEPSSLASTWPITGGAQQQGRGRGSMNGCGSADARPVKGDSGGSGVRIQRPGGESAPVARGEGRRAEEATADATQVQHQQARQQQLQERRGSAREGKAPPLTAMDGVVKKDQFETLEKNAKPEGPPAEMEHASGINTAGNRSSKQGGGVGVKVSHGRRDTPHTSLPRGGRKSGVHGVRSSEYGSDADELHSTLRGQQRTGENRLASPKNSGSFVGKYDSWDEYPPLGSSGMSLERAPKGWIAKPDLKDTVEVQGDIPNQHQASKDKGGKQAAPAKPLASTNRGSSGPKHKTAISMAIADIMVRKQRQPKKLKEKENLLERSSKKPEEGGWDP